MADDAGRSSDMEAVREKSDIPREHPRKDMRSSTWILSLIGLYLGALLYGLDTTIAANLQSPIYEAFRDIQNLPWIGIGFPMASVAVILLLGRLYGLFNIKILMISSVVIFEAGSALCGAAPNSAALVVGRVIAGIGGAGMYLGALTYLSIFTTERELPLYNALIGLSWGTGAILGPVVGGAFADSHATWRWAFYINLPLAGLLSPVYLFVFPSFSLRPKEPIVAKLKALDWTGAALNGATFVLFMIALTFSGSTYAWNSGPAIALWVIWVAVLMIFILQQAFAVFTTPVDRIFPVHFLKSKELVLLYICTSCAAAANAATLYYIPLFFSFTHGDKALQVAVRLLPFIIMFIFFVMVAGGSLPVLGRYAPYYTIGSALALTGSALMFTIRADTSVAKIYGYEILIGAGTGLMFQNAYAVVAAIVEPEDKANAVGYINVAQIGTIAIALSIAGSLFENLGVRFLRHALGDFHPSVEALQGALAGTESVLLSGGNAEITRITIDTVAYTISRTFAIGISASALGLWTVGPEEAKAWAMNSEAPVPPRQRRASPDRISSQSRTPIRTRSATSEDSETLWLPDPPTDASNAEKPKPAQASQPSLASSKPMQDDEEARKCWICFSDSTEDTPETSPWRDPYMESPKNTRKKGEILCPQCKSEIKLARPTDIIVDAARGIEHMSERLILPGAAVIVTKMVHSACIGFGDHAIHRIFGAEAGYRILKPLYASFIAPPIDLDMPIQQIAAQVLSRSIEHSKHWRVHFGLPLIAPLLILSRTMLADSVIPVLPVLFFATQPVASDEGLDFTSWPPSASMAFAVLPYLRVAYNTYYDKVWAARERQWLKEIQPRSGMSQNDEGAEQGNDDVVPAPPADEEDGDIFEVRIDGGIFQDWQGDVDQFDNIAGQNPVPPGEAVPANLDAAAAPLNIVDGRPPVQPGPEAQPNAQPVPQAQQNAQGERRLSFSPVAIAETVLGALVFPMIAEVSGEVLRGVLPSTWTTVAAVSASRFSFLSSPRPGAKGLLQEKWGRSLVGGCLFVMFKDAIMLYVRWKMARMHRNRRVLDVDRSKVNRNGR
ncbi:hypothetical protein B0A48_13003 [Cryoendolithus antarcticus]|uniref:Major facilitator superfamily (MFS) profile domain-containing protein n=1 Tax=Cryoendolithus antarcticus TaxID=1507870 RepID=A0A1V8SQZ8_9PEZI|nr:hypothetical protein B0A48_13003 [Cryoendolithus antarcticus]